MPVPRVGLTTYGRSDDKGFWLPVEYVDSVRRAGGLPVLLAPGEPCLAEWFASIDALVLPGGGDLRPEAHGGKGHPENYKMDADRDRDELRLARRAVDEGKPTLAICRGAQVLNVALGGSLIEHLPEAVGERVAHRSPEREPIPHPVSVDPDSRLAAVLGATELPGPASWHHQAIDRVAKGLRVVAHAPDGVVEAVEMPAHPFLIAVQWHPELTTADDPVQQRLFDALVGAAGD